MAKPDRYRRARRVEREALEERHSYQARGIPTRRWRELRGSFWRARRLEALRKIAGRPPALKRRAA